MLLSAPVSSPTRVSILTGCYQQRAGVNHIYSETDPMDGLNPEVFPAFATQLQAAGYRTGIMGKWHLGQAVDGGRRNAVATIAVDASIAHIVGQNEDYVGLLGVVL